MFTLVLGWTLPMCHCWMPLGPGSVYRCLTNYGHHITKIRWSNDHLIFIMRIPIPGKIVFILKQGPGAMPGPAESALCTADASRGLETASLGLPYQGSPQVSSDVRVWHVSVKSSGPCWDSVAPWYWGLQSWDGHLEWWGDYQDLDCHLVASWLPLVVVGESGMMYDMMTWLHWCRSLEFNYIDLNVVQHCYLVPKAWGVQNIDNANDCVLSDAIQTSSVVGFSVQVTDAHEALTYIDTPSLVNTLYGNRLLVNLLWPGLIVRHYRVKVVVSLWSQNTKYGF